jgi:hypothetical protein
MKSNNVSSESNESLYEIYAIDIYNNNETNEYFAEQKKTFSDVNELINELTLNNNGYHFWIRYDCTHIFFGDLDYFSPGILVFMKILKNFLKKYYNLIFTDDEFMYTENNCKKGSFHYSIPKWNLSIRKLNEIHTRLAKMYKIYFVKYKNGCIIKSVDTNIYCDHFYRCPNQKKGILSDNSIHIIKNGTMKDFIINYIPENSENIEHIRFFDNYYVTRPRLNTSISNYLNRIKNMKIQKYENMKI